MQDTPFRATALPNLSALENQHRVGANWFFWIAGLSLVNTAILLSGGDRNFVIGLGIASIMAAFGVGAAQANPEAALIIKGVALVFCLVASGVFAGFGALARRRHTWAFALGMTLYAFDALIYLLVQDWMSFGFHIFALVCLWSGLKACRELNQQALRPMMAPPEAIWVESS